MGSTRYGLTGLEPTAALADGDSPLGAQRRANGDLAAVDLVDLVEPAVVARLGQALFRGYHVHVDVSRSLAPCAAAGAEAWATPRDLDLGDKLPALPRSKPRAADEVDADEPAPPA